MASLSIISPTELPKSDEDSWSITIDLDTAWKALVLFIASFISHWQAIGGGFIWDDDAHITRVDLRSFEGLWAIWTKLGATQQYYPLVHSFFWFEHAFWGDAATYYHIINILLHSVVAILIVAVVKKLEIRGAWLAGFIFALHPVHVESVAWITEQKNTISAIFYLAAAYYYLKFDKERLNKIYAIASVFFICALLSKTVTATLPAALLVVFWWKKGSLSLKTDVLFLLPWFAIGASGGAFTAWVERTLIGAQGPDYQSAVILTSVTRCLLAAHVIWFYLAKLLWPANLIFIYEHWSISASNPVDYIYIIALITFLILLVRFANTNTEVDSDGLIARAPLAGFLFFCGTLFPVLGFANVYPFMFSYVADHFQYLASIGIIIPIAAFLTKYIEKLSAENRGYASAIGGVFLALLGFLSWNQCSMYKDAQTLYTNTIDRNPSCWMAHNNLGAILLGQGKINEATQQFEEALKIRPRYPDAQSNMCSVLIRLGRIEEALTHGYEAVKLRASAENENNLAIALADVGRTSEAVQHYLNALTIKPNYVEVLNNLGNAYMQLGKNTEAIACYQNAIKYNSNFPDAWSNLGVILVRMGNIEDGIKADEQAVRLKLNSATYHTNLGLAYSAVGRRDEALVQLQNSLQLDSNNSEVWYNYGNILAGMGRFAEAEIPYVNTLKLNPGNIGAENNLASVYFKLGRYPEAIAHYQIAIKANPNYAEAHNNLGVALIANKLIDDGISEYNKAIALNPKYADAYNNLGLAYMNSGKIEESINLFNRSIVLNNKNPEYNSNKQKATDLLHRKDSALK